MASFVAKSTSQICRKLRGVGCIRGLTERHSSSKSFPSRLQPKKKKKKPAVVETNRTLGFTEFDEGISINYGSESRQLMYFWLRDHSRDGTSYNHETHQKIILPHKIDPSIKPEKVDIEDNKLVIHWPGGGTVSSFDPEWLLENAYPGMEEWVPKFIWDDAAITGENVQHFPYAEFLTKEDTLKDMLRTLLKYGFAIVDGVLDEDGKPSAEATTKAIKRICDPWKTQFGEVWTFTNDKASSDSAWTNQALGAHTDNTYFSVPAGVQVLHCLHHDGRGGDTLLVDGFHAAETVRHEDPHGFTALTQLRVEHEFKESFYGRSAQLQGHVRTLETILRTHPVTGDLEWIRYNHYDRAPIRTVPPQDLKAFYRALNTLTKKVESPRREHWMKLTPGTVLFIDNWRVLHGRSAFTGDRRVCGCYLHRDDWMGRARSLGLIQ